MNRNEKSLLIGLGIGDGNIKSKKHKEYDYTQYSINFIHCSAQRDYIEYKADILHSIFGGSRPSVNYFNNNGYPAYRMQKTDKALKHIYNILYRDGKKYITRECLEYLTPKSIALWYMDDGNLAKKRRDGKIHAYELYINTFVSDDENDTIIKYFYDVWGVRFSKVENNGGYRLRCGTNEARKFIEIVDKYVIPCMKYKTDISKKSI